MLEIKNVTKKFGGFTAVDSLTLKLPTGTFYGFLGPNGAGKTTTIKIICGLLAADSGEIEFDGITISKNPVEFKKKIGYIPDQPYLYDKLTGKEFLSFSGSLYGMRLKELSNSIEEVISVLKIGDWIDKKTESYSQGMRQRISVASALLHKPELLIVDEPMVGLDPQSAKIVKEVFANLAKTGKTVFMSTHSLHVAEELCTDIAVIKEGKLLFDEPKEKLQERFLETGGNLEDFFIGLMNE